MIQGHATLEGTTRYRQRFLGLAPTHFRDGGGLVLSSIGLGTYLGAPDDATDTAYRDATLRALELGCNVVDTAVNYRCQRSERVVGAALRCAIDAGLVARDEIFVSTKGGFIPFEDRPPDDPAGYFQRAFVDTGIMEIDDLVAGCHCMTPRYLREMVRRSLHNLRLETIDLYYLHNPETQLIATERAEVYERLGEAFATLEQLVVEGQLRRYGIATWEALRASPEAKPYLSLREVARRAREVAGDDNHFRAIQLPLNLGMPEAFAQPSQHLGGETLPALAAAQRLELTVFASGSLHQGKLLGRIPAWLRRNLGEDASDAQRALQFARSCPGLTTALVGMSDPRHVEENLALGTTAPFTLSELQQVLEPPAP